MVGFFSRLKQSLIKTRQGLTDRMSELFTSSKKIDDDFYDELEEILVAADVGIRTTSRLLGQVKKEVAEKRLRDPEAVRSVLKSNIVEILGKEFSPLNLEGEKPRVVLVVGVNGVGKTTTIGKMAYMLKNEGKSVLLAAADTFRAAAIEQLEVWAERAGVQMVKHLEGADPAAVAYDSLQAARSRKADVVLIDTAGRLQTKKNLMAEAEKIRRVVEREIPGAPHEVLLVLDATTGQNAVSQVNLFDEALGISGLVLTKLDGTAKGGIVIAIRGELKVPVKLIGIGEKMEDLRPFNSEEFVQALFDKEQ